jgi:hypothetical protein
MWSRPDGGLPCGKFAPEPRASKTAGHFVVTTLAELEYQAAIKAASPWGHYLAFTSGHDRAIVCDLERGLTATVAEATSQEEGAIDYVVGSKDTVVYSRLSRVAQLDDASSAWTGWTIEAVDLQTGMHWAIDRNRQEKKAPDTEFGNLPFPEVDWPWVTWLHATSEKDAELWSFDLRSGRRQLIATLPNGGRIDMSDGLVVFDRITSKDFMQRDLYAVPADGSQEPRRLAALGGGQWPEVGGGRVVWDIKGSPSAGSRDADRTVWMHSLPNGPGPIQLGTGTAPRPGNGFILVSQNESLRLYDPRRPGEPSIEFASAKERGAAGVGLVGHDLILWGGGEEGRGTPKRLRLSRITVEP